MTNPDRARTLDAVANQRQVVAGVMSERRRAIGADAQTLVDRESAGDGVVRWRRRIQPNNTEDA